MDGRAATARAAAVQARAPWAARRECRSSRYGAHACCLRTEREAGAAVKSRVSAEMAGTPPARAPEWESARDSLGSRRALAPGAAPPQRARRLVSRTHPRPSGAPSGGRRAREHRPPRGLSAHLETRRWMRRLGRCEPRSRSLAGRADGYVRPRETPRAVGRAAYPPTGARGSHGSRRWHLQAPVFGRGRARRPASARRPTSSRHRQAVTLARRASPDDGGARRFDGTPSRERCSPSRPAVACAAGLAARSAGSRDGHSALSSECDAADADERWVGGGPITPGAGEGGTLGGGEGAGESSAGEATGDDAGAGECDTETRGSPSPDGARAPARCTGDTISATGGSTAAIRCHPNLGTLGGAIVATPPLARRATDPR